MELTLCPRLQSIVCFLLQYVTLLEFGVAQLCCCLTPHVHRQILKQNEHITTADSIVLYAIIMLMDAKVVAGM